MTVPNLPNSAIFQGSGSSGPFTFAFPFFENSDIVATVADPSGNTSNAVVDSITGAGTDTGGSLTLTDPLLSGYSLTITRSMQIEQQTTLPNGGPFFAATIESAFDYLTMIDQQLATRIGSIETRGFTINLTQVSAGTVVTTPVPTQYGNVVVNLPVSGTVKVMKIGTDVYTVSFAVTVGGQTIDPIDPLSVDGQFVELTLIGTQWRVTG